ncbi:MAG TPA: methylmalonyl-CoA mutase family protein [Candidatus Dormibacteraeota bacterium]|jgi:methylmalonyl-CoA mutase N-terminal domain/subunit|nr:methylmalonyl-CoA mutase family protein [Candidatus Dormibacteraeota bacterium]
MDTSVEPEVATASGLPVPSVAGPDLLAPGWEERIGRPGAFPFTRGIRAGMYRERPWTIRQLAGFGSAADTNHRYRVLLERGATGVNGVFDYPSLRAVDSDDPRARADVGRGGVAVDVREDFDDLFAGIPLDRTSVSLVSSQPIGAVVHLAMFVRSAERRGVAAESLSGTSQNDFLMETAITIAPEALPPAGSFRLECDLAEFALRRIPRWNPVSVSGYNYREAGADAPLELALTLAHGQAVARELIGRGLPAGRVLRRISFFLDACSDLFEEVAKYRAARRMWAGWVRDELGVDDPAAQRFRFHVQTSGVSNTARHAEVNIARSALQALAAVLGGTQSLHVNGYDEAVGIPTEEAALTALLTQRMILHETGVAASADPLGGSYLVEHLTDAMEERTGELVAHIDRLGGIVAATEQGWVHGQLAAIASRDQRMLESGERRVVGLNTDLETDGAPVDAFELPAGTLERQCARLAEVRARRDAGAADAALRRLEATCGEGANVMPAVLGAVDAEVTLGEIGRSLRETLGRWVFPLW